VVATLAVSACGGRDKAPVQLDIPFRTDGILEFVGAGDSLITRIAIEIADTDSAQARGLMDRRSLPERGGMLFVNDDVAPRSFWMRSTPLSLDILFLDANDHVINISRATTPYSDAHIESEGPAGHVLEVRSGFTQRWGIEPGTRVRWRRVDPGTS